MPPSSGTTRDPRGGAHKRQASRSPERDGAQAKRSATGVNLGADPRYRNRATSNHANFRANANGTNGDVPRRNSDQVRVSSQSAGSRTDQSPRAGNDARASAPAPPALMAGGVVPSGGQSNKRKFSELIMASHSQAATVAMCRISHNQAEAALQKAEREFKANQPHFADFQAIAEQKTTAKDRAEKRFRHAQQELQQAIDRQETITDELSDLFCTATETPPPPPPVAEPTEHIDVASRTQCERLATQVSELKATLESLKRAMADSEKETLRKTSEKIATLPSKDHSSDIEALATSVRSFETSIQKISSLSAAASDVRALETRLNALDSRVERTERAARDTPQASAPPTIPALVATQDLTPVFERLDHVEKEIGRVENDCEQAILDGNTGATEIFDEQIKSLKDEIDEKITAQRAAIDMCSNNVNDASIAIASLTTAVQTCTEEQSALQKSMEEFKDNVNGISNRASSTEGPVLADGQTPGLLRFTPVASGNEGENDRNAFEAQLVNGANASFNADHLRHMKNDIEMLKEKERLHTHQYNNLVTDNVVEVMVDAMAKQYPDAKNAQGAVDFLRHDIGTMREGTKHELKILQDSIANLQHNLDNNVQGLGLRMDSAEDGTNAAKDEATRLRNELSALSTRVEQDSQAVELGKKQMEQLGANLLAARQDLSELDGKFTAMCEVDQARAKAATNGTK